MTTAEYTEAVSIRATQIANGGTIYVDVGNLDNPIDIAKKEIASKKCPLVLRRVVGKEITKTANKTNKYVEYVEFWRVNDMA